MRYTLITPFKTCAKPVRELTELELRDYMTAGDIIEARRLTADKGDQFLLGAHLVARIAGLDINDVKAMDMRDFDFVDSYILTLRKPTDEDEGASDPKE